MAHASATLAEWERLAIKDQSFVETICGDVEKVTQILSSVLLRASYGDGQPTTDKSDKRQGKRKRQSEKLEVLPGDLERCNVACRLLFRLSWQASPLSRKLLLSSDKWTSVIDAVRQFVQSNNTHGNAVSLSEEDKFAEDHKYCDWEDLVEEEWSISVASSVILCLRHMLLFPGSTLPLLLLAPSTEKLHATSGAEPPLLLSVALAIASPSPFSDSDDSSSSDDDSDSAHQHRPSHRPRLGSSMLSRTLGLIAALGSRGGISSSVVAVDGELRQGTVRHDLWIEQHNSTGMAEYVGLDFISHFFEAKPCRLFRANSFATSAETLLPHRHHSDVVSGQCSSEPPITFGVNEVETLIRTSVHIPMPDRYSALTGDHSSVVKFMCDQESDVTPMRRGEDFLLVRTERQNGYFSVVNFDVDSEDLGATLQNQPLSDHNQNQPLSDHNLFSEALRRGYTLAVRALDCRCPQVAVLAQTLERVFGHGVTVNFYHTPPSSQGFEPHFDDHCVFVLQTEGSKRWRLGTSDTCPQLPLLHSSRQLPLEFDWVPETEVLEEGDVLYIPRGVIHEALNNAPTNTSSDSDSKGHDAGRRMSSHLTFALEVDPLFTFGGYAVVTSLWLLATVIGHSNTAEVERLGDASFSVDGKEYRLSPRSMSKVVRILKVAFSSPSTPPVRGKRRTKQEGHGGDVIESEDNESVDLRRAVVLTPLTATYTHLTKLMQHHLPRAMFALEGDETSSPTLENCVDLQPISHFLANDMDAVPPLLSLLIQCEVDALPEEPERDHQCAPNADEKVKILMEKLVKEVAQTCVEGSDANRCLLSSWQWMTKVQSEVLRHRQEERQLRLRASSWIDRHRNLSTMQ